MRMFLAPALVFALLAPAATAADKPDDAVAADLKAMVGKWKIEKAELGGKDILEHLKEVKFETKDGTTLLLITYKREKK